MHSDDDEPPGERPPSSGEMRAMKLNETLQQMAELGMDVRRDTTTTTNFSAVDTEELAQALESGHSEDGGFTLERCYDADDRGSVEIVCDNCRGFAHIKKNCPSPVKFRSFDYALAMLEKCKARAERRGTVRGAPVGGRTPPPRGQRPPFKRFPRRFQPRVPKGPPRQPLSYGRSVFDDDSGSEAADDAAGQAEQLRGVSIGADVAPGEEGARGATEQASQISTAQSPTQQQSETTMPLSFDDSGYFDDEIVESSVNRMSLEENVSCEDAGTEELGSTAVMHALIQFTLMIMLALGAWRWLATTVWETVETWVAWILESFGKLPMLGGSGAIIVALLLGRYVVHADAALITNSAAFLADYSIDSAYRLSGYEIDDLSRREPIIAEVGMRAGGGQQLQICIRGCV